uniref:Uncharacterized protein n=1 Tax=Arundo donax TaxID=35708 RepID=A0A0A9GXF9_ARUDO
MNGHVNNSFLLDLPNSFVNCFQIIWDLSNLLDRTILIDYLVFQNRRPNTHLSQIMEKMLVHYDKLTA